jgi:hypothetical protein
MVNYGREQKLIFLSCYEGKTDMIRLGQAGRQERLAGKIGCIRRKTGRLGQAGRKGWQKR